MTNDLQQLHDAKNSGFVARLHLELSKLRSGLRDSSKTVESDAGASSTSTDAPGEVDAGSNIGGSQVCAAATTKG